MFDGLGVGAESIMRYGEEFAMIRITIITLLAAAALTNAPGLADPHANKDGMMDLSIHTPRDVKWVDAPPSLPRGAKIAVLEGDPSKEGPFVFRALLPDGYRIPPHIHPKVERITVISGTFNVGMGDRFEQAKTQAMPAGAYGYWPAGMKHFVWAKGETVIQFHGIGPWGLQYVNPEDDPRNAKR
jgi:quercetin dioxygenase-like cupin family protein